MTREDRKPRRCGDCNLCCTVMAVNDLEPPKPASVRCANVCSRGCRIYAARPQSCRDFVCIWAQGALPRAFRPDRVGIVFSSTPDGDVMAGYVDPARPDLWRQEVAPFLEGAGRRGALCYVGPAGGKPRWVFDQTGAHERPEEQS